MKLTLWMDAVNTPERSLAKAFAFGHKYHPYAIHAQSLWKISSNIPKLFPDLQAFKAHQQSPSTVHVPYPLNVYD